MLHITPNGRPGCGSIGRARLPDAELHSFETGHFALEEKLPEIVPLIADFVDQTWQVSGN